MVKTSAVTVERRTPLDKEFWANELEFDSVRAEHALAEEGALHRWIDELSGQQARMLCLLIGLNHEDSIQKLRLLLQEKAKELTPFFLVEQFGRGKSEIAVVEVAREALSSSLIALCVRKKRNGGNAAEGEESSDERYDKGALLFALYAKFPNLLKEVFHFDKVHKKGFASLVLAEAAKQSPKVPLGDFLTEAAVQGIVQAYQQSRRDGSVSELQGVWSREGRHYIFIRRTERPDHIHDGRHIVHGYRAEWIVLDFSPEANQVNIASHSLAEPREMAERIASGYFGCECRFVNEEKMTPADTVQKFVKTVRAGNNGLGLVETCVANSPLRGASKLRISNETTKALGESLDHIDAAVGDLLENLADIEWVKVLFRGKRVGLQFEPNESDDGLYVVRYTDQRLNAFERRRFEQQMRSDHGIAILSTEKR
jgi:hypothetical protein